MVSPCQQREIIFTANVTTAINQAYSYGRGFCKREIVFKQWNIIPTLCLEKRKKTNLKVIPVADDGTLDLSAFDRLIAIRPNCCHYLYF